VVFLALVLGSAATWAFSADDDGNSISDAISAVATNVARARALLIGPPPTNSRSARGASGRPTATDEHVVPPLVPGFVSTRTRLRAGTRSNAAYAVGLGNCGVITRRNWWRPKENEQIEAMFVPERRERLWALRGDPLTDGVCSNASSRDERAPARLFGEAKPIKATSRVEKSPRTRGSFWLLLVYGPNATSRDQTPRSTEWRDTCIGEEGHDVPAIIEEPLDRSHGVVVGDQPASRPPAICNSVAISTK
jgi:hypothetical protein